MAESCEADRRTCSWSCSSSVVLDRYSQSASGNPVRSSNRAASDWSPIQLHAAQHGVAVVERDDRRLAVEELVLTRRPLESVMASSANLPPGFWSTLTSWTSLGTPLLRVTSPPPRLPPVPLRRTTTERHPHKGDRQRVTNQNVAS